eukprot:7916751-Ditylum_brightwellii.AAC.1
MEVFNVAVAWDTMTPALQNPNEVINILKSQRVMRAQVKMHNNQVWATIVHGGRANKTPTYLKVLGALPTDVVAPSKLRQVMFGKMLWNSINWKYQLELLTKESLVTKEGNHNGLMSWHHIMER